MAFAEDFQREQNAPTESDRLGAAPVALTQTMREKLKQMVLRIERLEEEKIGISSDIKDAYDEAKGFGYDVKALRKVIAMRKLDVQKRTEMENWIDLYRQALGDI